MSLAVMIVLASSWGHGPTTTTRRLRSNMPGLKASAITEDGLRCSPDFRAVGFLIEVDDRLAIVLWSQLPLLLVCWLGFRA